MFRSIRTALLFWYGLTFLLLLLGFGTSVYVRLRRSVFKAVDAKLETYAHSLAGGLVEMDDGSVDLEVPKSFRQLFRRGDDLPYYIVWDRAGKIIHRSAAAPDAVRPVNASPRSSGSSREVAIQGPAGTWVLVGRLAKHEMENLTEFLVFSLSAGGGFMLLALGGGWFLVARSLGPIDRISRAAEQISGLNLSRRIDPAHMESELGQLASTLNGMFDRLQSAFDQQARFTADASHELRTPLSLILSRAELALNRERPSDEYRESLQIIDRAAQRMKAVVEGLLLLARADAQQLTLVREPVSLAALAEEIVGLLGPLATEKGVRVTVRTQPALVEGDPERLRDVVTNLLTNSIRYTPQGGRVGVAVLEKPEGIVLEVEDTGIGIPEKDQPHIFERFYRVDQARTRDRGGSGLGLAIAKWIVGAHHGSISFASREGHGTTFTVTLPKGPMPSPLPGSLGGVNDRAAR